MAKLILTSHGLNNELGFKLISKKINKEDVLNKKIILIYEPYDFVQEILINACIKLGFNKENIILCNYKTPLEIFNTVDYIYVTEGNTYEILSIMKDNKQLESIYNAVKNGATYIGASAGAIIAGNDITLARDFDKNYIGLVNCNALGLYDGNIIPHAKSIQSDYLTIKDDEIVILEV